VTSTPSAGARSRDAAFGSRGIELAEARIDLAAIAENTRWFAHRAAGAQLMAVVKADAFGHGMVPVAATVLDAGATWLGVARMREGLAIRAAGLPAPVLAWLLEPGFLGEAIDAAIDVSVSSVDDLECIAAAATTRHAEVHLKLDTGLHRAGVPVELWPAVMARAAALERRRRLHVRGIWSHLSHGDVPDSPQIPRQQALLAAGIRVAHEHGLAPEVTHLANSGGVMQVGSGGCSMVRVGAGLYGIEVIRGQHHTLRPAMSVTTRVVGVRSVAAGEGIGYGHASSAPASTRLALVPVGYADGVPRTVGNRARMLIGDTRVAVVGPISMDQTILDVGDRPVRVGDAVTMFGAGGDGAPTVQDWADWAGTIPHEILTRIGDRVTRRTVGLPS
jgi:alanine racemase